MTDDPAAYWDAQAAAFDEEPDHGLGDPAARAAWERLLLPLAPPAARVADLGCGTGSLSVLLARAGHEVVGVDIAPRMIDAARAKARAACVDVRFAVADAAAPGLPHGEFDVVLARHVLWAMPDVDATLREWVALLRPSGRLVLVEGRWHTGAGMTSAQAVQAVLGQRDAGLRDAAGRRRSLGRANRG